MRTDLLPYVSTLLPYISLTVERYAWWSCVLNYFMLSSLTCFPVFADLLSLHLVTFLFYYITIEACQWLF